ncbi:MAG TPA: hypothetical protein ENG35_00965 [Desulfobacteraceae bacterium]|nr:hypothetical protein [Desulfobacteraceae bacterium]
MPEYLKYNEKEFLSRTYEDIIYEDIISRYKLKATVMISISLWSDPPATPGSAAIEKCSLKMKRLDINNSNA